MDNVSYHSRQIAPNRSSTITEIQVYLIGNDIYFELGYNKEQLLLGLYTYNVEK